jgi:NADPH-dependent 2,4-dienoyl-CoA reductase/sulfur reductase-like enzyme
MARTLNSTAARHVADLHCSRGIDIKLGVHVTEADDQGLTLSDGTAIEADIAVIGIGIKPNIEFLEGSGIEIADGVVVDEGGRTNVPDVYAVGDVAAQMDPQLGRRVRVETWANAENQSQVVARNICGLASSYQDSPYFWSIQHGVNIQCVGAPTSDTDVIRATGTDGKFAVFHMTGGRLTGATTLGDGKTMGLARRLVAQRCAVSIEMLGNPDFDLRTLLR